MSTRALEGKIPGSGGKGLVDIMVFKKLLLTYMCDHLIPSKSLPADVKSKIREITVDFQAWVMLWRYVVCRSQSIQWCCPAPARQIWQRVGLHKPC